MFHALHATSETLRDYLQTSIDADPFFGTAGHPWRDRNMRVRLQTPAEMMDDNDEGLSLWLYRVVRDEERLNDPARRVSPTELEPPPLPVCLHYLLTPVTNRDNEGDPDTEQYVLGKVLQLFHFKAHFRGPDLRGQFLGTRNELFVRLETLTLDEITRVWEGLNGSYQLSVSYEVSMVNIAAALERQRISPVLVALPEYGLASIVSETP
jgi:Pvc16 N-terminal domain